MAENKTKANSVSVSSFIDSVENQRRRHDAETLLTLYNKVTGQEPVMWGTSIIGYGEYTYELANGKHEKCLRSGFSPRKQNLTLYVGAGIAEHSEILTTLGKHKTSKACLYINKLADVDMKVLEQLIEADLAVMNQRYPQ